MAVAANLKSRNSKRSETSLVDGMKHVQFIEPQCPHVVKHSSCAMAESNAHPSEEDLSYFCFDCRNTAEESETVFFFVASLGPCYTCIQCGDVFEAGFKREKVNSME
ncbi:hypothetical protein TNCV_2619951 [Trichonephila clavipes]|uniref:Uncharacterized protein n=1 Tax=Trichonephila clavipes TaxID=2585209 RepID=A0A8X7BLN8_TRICX|nr:hypothetical protein TNCV_2619951 [Trichonephila clavipes]